MQRLRSPCTWTVRFHKHFNQNLVHTSQKWRQAHGTANIPQVDNCLEHTSAAVDIIFSSSKRTVVEDFGIPKKISARSRSFGLFESIDSWERKKLTSYTNRALSITGFSFDTITTDVRLQRAKQEIV